MGFFSFPPCTAYCFCFSLQGASAFNRIVSAYDSVTVSAQLILSICVLSCFLGVWCLNVRFCIISTFSPSCVKFAAYFSASYEVSLTALNALTSKDLLLLPSRLRDEYFRSYFLGTPLGYIICSSQSSYPVKSNYQRVLSSVGGRLEEPHHINTSIYTSVAVWHTFQGWECVKQRWACQ